MAEYIRYEAPRGPKIYRFGKYSFSNTEIKHLGIAFFMISLTLMALQRGMIGGQVGLFEFLIGFFFSVGLGFVLHELGHKFVAQFYGFISEFRADFMMLFVSFLIAALFQFTFLAPGAVLILGRPTRKQNGIISIAGPLVNLSLAFIYIIIGMILMPSSGLLGFILTIGISVNAFLGIFNMLPFWILDGKKVLAWNKPVYFSVFGLLVLVMIGNAFGLFF